MQVVSRSSPANKQAKQTQSQTSEAVHVACVSLGLGRVVSIGLIQQALYTKKNLERRDVNKRFYKDSATPDMIP